MFPSTATSYMYIIIIIIIIIYYTCIIIIIIIIIYYTCTLYIHAVEILIRGYSGYMSVSHNAFMQLYNFRVDVHYLEYITNINVIIMKL